MEEAMPNSVAITNTDHTAEGLKALAGKCKDKNQSRRLRAIARVIEGEHTRAEIAPLRQPGLRDRRCRQGEGWRSLVGFHQLPGSDPHARRSKLGRIGMRNIRGTFSASKIIPVPRNFPVLVLQAKFVS